MKKGIREVNEGNEREEEEGRVNEGNEREEGEEMGVNEEKKGKRWE